MKMHQALIRSLGTVALTFSALSPLLAASSSDGGRLGTLPVGQYLCALPGDAAGAAWRPLEGKEFSIGNASTYRVADGAGTYLLAGDTVTFTRGPMKGIRFKRTGTATLRVLDDTGKPGDMRCVRKGDSR